MSPSPQRTTFIVPPSPSTPPSSTSGPKPAREATPFVIVPTALGADERDTLEPHWLVAIEKATD